jgi:hypothetical protein
VPTTRELSYALYGAWLLARRNPTGLLFFDSSVEGCRRSFTAALICFLPFLILLGLRVPESAWHGDGVTRMLAAQTIAYVMGWAASPLAFQFLCRLVEREERFLAYVTAYNWSQVLQYALLMGIVGLTASGLLPPLAGAVLLELAMLLIYVYSWYIARVSLHVGGFQAVAFVLLDLVLTVAISRVADRLSF